MGKKGKRPRASARQQQHDLRKLARDRERLAKLLPGGSPDRPIEIGTPAVVEVRARSTPCPVCGGELALSEHAAVVHGEVRLRVARCRCRACGGAREIWFRLAETLPN